MTTALTTQSSFLAQTGQLAKYRSGLYGTFTNQGDVQNINGFNIDLSGTSSSLLQTTAFTPGKGVKTYNPAAPASGLVAPDTFSTLLQLQNTAAFTPDNLKNVMNADASAYIAAVPENITVSYQPAGTEPQSVEGLGYFPGDVFQNGNQIDYMKQQITRTGELAKIEANLQKQYGQDVKIAFDPMGGEYMMLRPGQAGYDSVKSARDVLNQVPDDLRKMVPDPSIFSDVLAKYQYLMT